MQSPPSDIYSDSARNEIFAEASRRWMLQYIAYLWQSKEAEPFRIGVHTREICREIDTAITTYRAGQSSFIILTVPPRHGKSEIVSRMLPTRWLGLFPDTEAMIVSYSASLAETFSKDGRKIMRSPEYRNVFPRVSLAHDNQGVQEWGIELDGQPCRGKAQFSGMDGSNTGKGASLIIVDDPLKGRQEADSELLRDKCWDVFRSDILSRRAPVSIVIITLTRWHQDDIVGRIMALMEKDKTFPRFKVLSWPATSDKYQWLFPERYSPEYYQAQKSLIGNHAWSSLYMCSPVPREGNILRADKVKVLEPAVFDKLTASLRFARGWDLASGEDRMKENPDYTSGCKLAKKMIPTAMQGLSMPVFYIADYVRGKWEAMERNNKIISTAMGDGDIRVGVEAFGAYKDAYTTVRDVLNGIRSVHKSQLPGDKLSKADAVAPAFEAGNVYMRKGPWNDEVLKQYAEFPGGQHDDDVDALCVANDTLQFQTEWS
jgi:predicted phage terminase large subunit-like protein